MDQIEQTIQPFIYYQTKNLFLKNGNRGQIFAKSLNVVILAMKQKGLLVTDKTFKVYCKFTKKAFDLFMSSVPKEFTLEDLKYKVITIYNPYMKIFGNMKKQELNKPNFKMMIRLVVDEFILAPKLVIGVDPHEDLIQVDSHPDIQTLMNYKFQQQIFMAAQSKLENDILTLNQVINAQEGGKKCQTYESASIEINPFKCSIQGFKHIQKQDFDIDQLSSEEEEKNETSLDPYSFRGLIQILEDRRRKQEAFGLKEASKKKDFEELKNVLFQAMDDQLDMQSSQSQHQQQNSQSYKPQIGLRPNYQEEQKNLILSKEQQKETKTKKVPESQQDLLDMIKDSSQSESKLNIQIQGGNQANKKQEAEETKDNNNKQNHQPMITSRITTEQSQEPLYIEIGKISEQEYTNWINNLTENEFEAYKAWFQTTVAGNQPKPQFKPNHNFKIQVVENEKNDQETQPIEVMLERPKLKEETTAKKKKIKEVDYCKVVQQEVTAKEKMDNVFEGESVVESISSSEKDDKREKVRQIPTFTKESKKRKQPEFKREESKKKPKQKKYSNFL